MLCKFRILRAGVGAGVYHCHRESSPEHRVDFRYILHAVTCEEVQPVKLPSKSTPRLYGITRQWTAVPASVKSLFFNVIRAKGGFSSELLTSKPVFLAKEMSLTSADFRPINVSLVVVWHSHKIPTDSCES